MGERGEGDGLEPHMAAVVEALVEHDVVEELLEVEVWVGRAVLVEWQHVDDRAEQRREVDSLAVGRGRQAEGEPVGAAAFQAGADLHRPLVQMAGRARVDLDAPAFGAQLRHGLGDEGERLAPGGVVVGIRRPGPAGEGVVKRLGAALEAQVIEIVERVLTQPLALGTTMAFSRRSSTKSSGSGCRRPGSRCQSLAVRLDPLLMDQPGRHLGAAVGGVGDQTLGVTDDAARSRR
jgi:hypothetical protein